MYGCVLIEMIEDLKEKIFFYQPVFFGLMELRIFAEFWFFAVILDSQAYEIAKH